MLRTHLPVPKTPSSQASIARPLCARFHPHLRVRAAVATVALAGLTLCPTNLWAQSSPALVDLLRTTFVDSVVIAKTPGGNGVVAHTPVFLDDPRVTTVTTLIQQVNQNIGAQVSSFPLGSSAGGFTYNFDSATGMFSRSTNSFGPAFAERAVTIGVRKLNFGANYLHASYNSLDGRNLQNGDISFFLLHQPLSPPSFVEGDVIQAALSMKLTSDVFTAFANFGLSNALDVGVTIPVVRVKMDLTYHATILDFATHAVSPNTHLFANGTKAQDFTAQGSASGLGDIVVRAKYNFLKRAGGGLAAGLDVHLPTGRDVDLLGTGATRAKVFLIASESKGKFSPHINIGYTYSATGKTFPVPSEINYSGGLEFTATPRITIVGDLVGRTDRNAFRLVSSPQTHTFQQGNDAPVETTILPEVATSIGNLSTVVSALGVRWNPGQNLVISVHILAPLNSAGLHARPTPVVGFDYAF
jgi:hypothetical protein